MLRREIHESRQGRLTQLRGTSQRDLILAIEFKREQSRGFLGEAAPVQVRGLQKFRRQFNVYGFHKPKL